MSTVPNYAIDPNKLSTARGHLIVALGRDVKWQEFAKLCDLTLGTISNIRNGRSGGNPSTWQKIVNALRANGVTITEESLLRPANSLS